MTASRSGLRHLLSMGILSSTILSYCTLVGAWRATKLRSPSFPSTRLQANHRVFKYKQDPVEEEALRREPFLGYVPFKKRTNSTLTGKNKKNVQYVLDEDEKEEEWDNESTRTLNDKSKNFPRRYQVRKELAKRFKVKGIFSKNKPRPYQIPLRAPEVATRRFKIFVKPTKLNSNRTIVTHVDELRRAVLDEGQKLEHIDFKDVSFMPSSNSTNSKEKMKGFNPLNHEVIKLIKMRASTKSKPGARAPNDNANLALSIEGGGMRGAVSAGMASAIAVLGLSDAFDSIYGSSAGSVVGAYMVSRQMCIDVYTEVLTTAKTKFVSKGRLASSLATSLFDTRVLNNTVLSKYVNPAMNISFVLDSVMCPEHGLRPLDIEKFRINDERQQLRIVTSTVRDGKMETHCLGSKTMDFFDRVHDETGDVLEEATTMLKSKRHGLFACLETSMLVPAATGPPLTLLRNKDAHLNITTDCFDAFCYEPIPYRSAVAEGATHVLALKSRPEGAPIGTKPGLFEKYFAPVHFETNNMPEVAKFFENGGQQYLYTEDYLTLDEGKMHLVNEKDPQSSEGILVPPRDILYGVDLDDEAQTLAANRDDWDRAHLFPLSVPEGKPELSVLSVDQDQVLEGVRLGFAAAFDLLAPVANVVGLNERLDGNRVAELLFSHVGTAKNVLEIPVAIKGDYILEDERFAMMDEGDYLKRNNVDALQQNGSPDALCPKKDASELLDLLPGFHKGKMISLSKGLHQIKHGEGEASPNQ